MSAIATAAAAAAKRDSKSNINKDKDVNVRDNNNQKSSVNTNNNNNNNTNNNKVVIVATPQQIPHQIALAAAAKAAARTPSPIGVSLQQLQQSQQTTSFQYTSVATSSNVAIPQLKKRKGVVKQSVPPPVPPRGSPRSKSNIIGVSSSSFTIHGIYTKSLSRRSPVNVEMNVGCRKKVEEWLAKIEPPAPQETSLSLYNENIIKCSSYTFPGRVVDQSVNFKNVGKLIEAFTTSPQQPQRQSKQSNSRISSSSRRNRKISDSSFVRTRIDTYNSLDRYRTTINRNLMSSDGGTDSGIDIPTTAGLRVCLTNTTSSLNRRRHDEEEEFV